ncbi:MAG: response regulator transcription factor [Rhizobiales bacterium]|nr:response regulator transcription factor [Hyphomicrobiales bacterium]
MGQTLAFSQDALVFIVDDDQTVRETLALLLRIEGFSTQSFSGDGAFLAAVRIASPACVVMDLNPPGRSGLEILKDLSNLKCAAPIIVMSGKSDIATAVAAMKHGALDFLEKPFAASAILERVRDAVATYRRTSAASLYGLSDFPGCHLLTSREREVLGQVAAGASNKEAGRRLGISPRTIEVHRARIMDKLGARNAADLMRIVLSQNGARTHMRAI